MKYNLFETETQNLLSGPRVTHRWLGSGESEEPGESQIKRQVDLSVVSHSSTRQVMVR